MEDDEIEGSEISCEVVDSCDIMSSQIITPSEVMQVVPSSFVALQPNLDPGSDVTLDCNNIILSNNLIVEHNFEVPGGLLNQRDIILVQNPEARNEVIQESEVTLQSNSSSSKVAKDDSNFRCDGDEQNYDPFQNLVIDIESKLEDSLPTPEQKFECSHCKTMLKTRSTLKRHIRMFHSESGRKDSRSQNKSLQVPDPVNKIYSCPACSFTTGRRDKMDKHVQKHVDDGFHPSGKKRNHPDQPLQRQHHNAEEYHCEYCPYSCTVEKALIKHQKLHNTTKEFVLKVSCKICGKDRFNDIELKKHMRKHISGENFICDICGFTSVQLKKVIQHRRMHTGERPHLCPFCSYRAARRDNLRSHVRRMHKKENMYIDTFNPTDSLDDGSQTQN